MRQGTDEQAQELIKQEFPSYEPWAEPIFKPDLESEALLFAAQTLLGFLLLTYCLHRLGIFKKGRRS